MTSKTVRTTVKTRRLSPWRVLLAIAVITLIAAISMLWWREWRVDPAILSNKPWFAPYVDVTASPQFSFDQIGAGTHKDVVLSFIVSSPDDSCQPSWGGTYTMKQASDDLDLDRRIARLKQQGGDIAVSFGGLKNHELATKCKDDSKLLGAYRDVVNRYDLTTMDLDLEKDNLTDSVVNARRAQAIAKLQNERRIAGKPLAVWLTLPVTSQGLNEDGINAMTALLEANVDISGINIMAMNYNESEISGKSMSDVAISALENTKRQVGVIYDRIGTHLSSPSLWRKIGVTPMIGQTDVKSEVFSLDDAKKVNKFTRDRGVGRVSMWSANRDKQCGSNYIDISKVSDSCSGIKQDKYAFMTLLGDEFVGNIAGSAVNKTVSEAKPTAKDLKDDPKTSPYSIWSEKGSYLKGTKVVWHRNVYQAKWWTKGDMPDNPVLQSWETPWELIGPVLPGEKLISQPKLPAGTYPEWSGDSAYEAGQHVLYEGIPYQAKWWNRGESPAAFASDTDGSPWIPLTQAEINKIINS